MGNQPARGNEGEAEQTSAKKNVSSLFSVIKKKFRSEPPKKEKFIVFGQDMKGVNFLLQLDSANNKLMNLPAPNNVDFYNYSGVTMVDENRMIVCGGIKFNLTGITNRCFEYDFKENLFRPISVMNEMRYTFPVIRHDNRVYAVGGRVYGDDTVSLLKKCEYYDLTTKTWHSIADMNITRCTSSLLVYNNQVWVVGGYSGRFQRTKKIVSFFINNEIS